ncbi:MAG: hypothetical protein ACREUT_22210 [Steroidobacteraceae bacterium]
MLRGAITAVAALVACAGLALLVRGEPVGGWQMLAGGLIVLVGIVFERWRYRNPAERPDGTWEATGERFVDPSSGEPVEVFFNPRTGERRYVAEKQAPPAQRH